VARTDTSHENVTRFFGLSTDTKPTNAMVGATFTETDTQEEFVYDGVNWTRDKTVVVEQVGAVEVKDTATTNDLLSEILTQQKLTNAYLAIVTDVILDNDCIPEEE
jgi:hypothetical protein